MIRTDNGEKIRPERTRDGQKIGYDGNGKMIRTDNGEKI